MESSACVCSHGERQAGASPQRLGRRAGGRSTSARRRCESRCRSPNQDHRRDAPLPASDGAADSEQHARFLVGDAALLEYLPDAVIPYAGSRHIQRTEIRLGCGASLLWWEILAPGRLAAGERFAFERLRVQTEVYAGPRPVLRDDFHLEPGRRDLTAKVRMSEYSHLASLCVVQEGRPAPFWRALEERLNGIARKRTRPGQEIRGASTLAADGVIVRGLSESGCFLHEALVEFWRTARLAVTAADVMDGIAGMIHEVQVEATFPDGRNW